MAHKPDSKMIAEHVSKQSLDIQHSFNSAAPFRHVEVDNFLEPSACEKLLADFPVFDKKYALNEHGEVGGKAVIERVSGVSPFYKSFYDYINSRKFLDAMSDLTGIPDLIADPTLFGGGTHENRHGQGLDVHIDFNIDERRMLHRRLNLLIYLNHEWDESWGGAIELHSDPWTPAANSIRSFLPLFNKAVIFETNEYSWHGFKRIELPDAKRELSRKSFSIYLYTKDRPAEEVVAPHTTFYVPAPLPSTFVSGHTLSEADATQLKILMASRDGLLKMYQKLLVEKEQRIRDFVKSKQRIVEPTYVSGQAASHDIRDCPICKSAGQKAVHIGTLSNTTEAKLQQTEYELAQCSDCAVVYLSPAPSDADLTKMYVDSAQFSDDTYTDEKRVTAINSYMQSCLERILSQQGKTAADSYKVLEVGAGLAWMSRAAKQVSPSSVTVAQDVSPEAVARCAWVDTYIQGQVSDERLKNHAPYDVISLTHVIEHLVDPVSAMHSCAKLLAKDGIVFITAPHRPTGWREGTRNIRPWREGSYTHVPAHIQYFSEASMQKLAEQCGLRVVHWNAGHEDGQAFEAWLSHRGADAALSASPSFVQRAARAALRRIGMR
jgi:SAM-dependent methyltransferase